MRGNLILAGLLHTQFKTLTVANIAISAKDTAMGMTCANQPLTGPRWGDDDWEGSSRSRSFPRGPVVHLPGDIGKFNADLSLSCFLNSLATLMSSLCAKSKRLKSGSNDQNRKNNMHWIEQNSGSFSNV